MNWSAGVGAGHWFCHGEGIDFMAFTESRKHLSSSFLWHHHQGIHHGNPPLCEICMVFRVPFYIGCCKRNSHCNGQLHQLPLRWWRLIFCGSTFSQDCKRRELCRFFLLELVNLKLLQKISKISSQVLQAYNTPLSHDQIWQNQKCCPTPHFLGYLATTHLVASWWHY